MCSVSSLIYPSGLGSELSPELDPKLGWGASKS